METLQKVLICLSEELRNFKYNILIKSKRELFDFTAIAIHFPHTAAYSYTTQLKDASENFCKSLSPNIATKYTGYQYILPQGNKLASSWHLCALKIVLIEHDCVFRSYIQ